MTVIQLILLMETKHLFADFFWQTEKHLGKFGKTKWVIPLADHCLRHAVLTLVICLAANPTMWWLCLVDFVAHFIMDRVKASPDLMGRYESLSKREYYAATNSQRRSNKFFWWCLGIDQYVHQLTSLFIVWMLCGGTYG